MTLSVKGFYKMLHCYIIHFIESMHVIENLQNNKIIYIINYTLLLYSSCILAVTFN